ncbi:MAG: HEPN domain-containing protein [Planctomycetes bacterium]|nr:HEPN domain-containing protein [Planctomycetota bacterium]
MLSLPAVCRELLKALLTLHAIEAPRTHSLRRLIQLAEPLAEELCALADASDALTAHGVSSRYPDDAREIDADEMKDMIALAKKFGAILRPKLER